MMMEVRVVVVLEQSTALGRGTRAFSGVTEMSSILIWVLVT